MITRFGILVRDLGDDLLLDFCERNRLVRETRAIREEGCAEVSFVEEAIQMQFHRWRRIE